MGKLKKMLTIYVNNKKKNKCEKHFLFSIIILLECNCKEIYLLFINLLRLFCVLNIYLFQMNNNCKK